MLYRQWGWYTCVSTMTSLQDNLHIPIYFQQVLYRGEPSLRRLATPQTVSTDTSQGHSASNPQNGPYS